MSEANFKSLSRMILVVLVCMTMAIGAFAQSTTAGAIGGTVTDQSKAIVPNAKVTIVNTGTNDKRTATADAEGKFRVVNLQPGTYLVTVEAASFAVYKKQVVVEVGRVSELEFALGASAKAETVDVTTQAPVINTVQQDFAHNLDQTTINELPINGRRWSNFALLTPGAAPDGAFGLISFRGISGLLNNNTVDGGDNNQAFFSEERGRTRAAYVVSQASVREFQVNTSNFSAEYGRAAGAVVNAVTKSGTNKIHGNAFYYIRDNELGTTNPSTFITTKDSTGKYVSSPLKPEDRRQQFGGTVGGPIIKDKMFFFFSYDQQKRNYPGTATFGNPGTTLDPVSAADLTTFSGRFKGANALADATAAFNSGIAFLNSLTGVVPRKGDQTIFFPKIDYRFSPNHTLALSYNRMRWNSPAGVQSTPTVTRGIASWGDDYVKVDSLTARLSSAFGSNVSNEARFQYGRDFEFQLPQPSAPGEPLTSPTGLTPSTAITNALTFGAANFMTRYAYPDELRYQYADTMSVSKGKHLFKFGVDINKVHEKVDNLFSENGVYSFSSRLNFITDWYAYKNNLTDTNNCGAANNLPCFKNYSSFSQGFGNGRFQFDTWDMAYFLQDDWRILPRLTLNLGVRYEYQKMPGIQNPNPAIAETTKFNSDKNNIGPRVGMAWDVFGDGKTSLRGGYGVYYGRINNGVIGQGLTQTGVGGSTAPSYTTTTGPRWPYVISTAATVVPSIVYLDSKLQNPRIQQVDLVLEREVAKNTTLSLSYLGSFGSNLIVFVDRNLPAATQSPVKVVGGSQWDGSYTMSTYRGSARPNTKYNAMTDAQSTASSNYHALVVQVNRRMMNGLQFNNSFTWSHAIDDGQNSQTLSQAQSPLDPNNLAAERGTSNFDMRKRWVSTIVWQPQYFKHRGLLVRSFLDNWTIAPIVTVASGRPFTEFVGTSGTTGFVSTGASGSGSNNSRFFLLQRNSFHFPHTENVDLRFSKRFDVKEGHKVEVLMEAFNLFNRRNLTAVTDQAFVLTQPTTGNYTLTYQPTTFNTPSQYNNNTIFRERQVQLALRYEF